MINLRGHKDTNAAVVVSLKMRPSSFNAFLAKGDVEVQLLPLIAALAEQKPSVRGSDNFGFVTPPAAQPIGYSSVR